MRSGVGLCVLGLLCLHGAVFGQDAAADPPPGILMFCDNPMVEKAATSALHKFNEQMTTGHKLALYQILAASKSESGSDSIYSLQFTSRKSDCLAGSPKPWNECNYLPHTRKTPVSCNATVHMTETETDARQVDCSLDDPIHPERSSCLGCPEDIPVESEDLKVPLTISVSKYNSISDHTHLFDLHSISVATRQVVAGFRFKMTFDLKKTICSKADDTEQLCVPDEENVEFSHCNSTVDMAPWRLEPPRAHIECGAGPLRTRLVRRRPPGWSPLRNILLDLPSPAGTAAAIAAEAPAAAAAAMATNAPVKESSEEEDTTGMKPTNGPDVAANDNPFHCPSKPWRPFQMDVEGGEKPTEASDPPADGTFSDKDLLG